MDQKYLILLLGVLIVICFGSYKFVTTRENYSYSFGFPTWNSMNRRVRFIPQRRPVYLYNPFLERTPVIHYDNEYELGNVIPDCYIPSRRGGCVRGFGRLGNKCCNMRAFV